MSNDVIENGSGLTPAQLDVLKARLLAERERVRVRLDARRVRLRDMEVGAPDENDWASASADQSLLATLADRDDARLREVDHALRKLDAGEYGVCERGGGPIGFDRLRVAPWTRFAVPEQELEERLARLAA